MRSTMMQSPLSLNQLLEHAHALFSGREVVSVRTPISGRPVERENEAYHRQVSVPFHIDRSVRTDSP